MDKFSYGFIIVIIIIMLSKLFFEWYMYRKSVYKELYSNFTEYRMKRKSIDNLSESYYLNEKFEKAKLLYYVLDGKKYKPSSFVIVILKSGFYVFGLINNNKISNNMMSTMNEFVKYYIKDRLDTTIYEKKVKIYCYFVKNEKKFLEISKPSNFKGKVVSTKDIVKILEKNDKENDTELIYTKEDINHIFQILIKNDIEGN